MVQYAEDIYDVIESRPADCLPYGQGQRRVRQVDCNALSDPIVLPERN